MHCETDVNITKIPHADVLVHMGKTMDNKKIGLGKRKRLSVKKGLKADAEKGKVTVNVVIDGVLFKKNVVNLHMVYSSNNCNSAANVIC